MRSDVTDLKDTVTNTALAMQETQKAVNESPLALRIKGITLTPGGFLAAETVWRQRGLASDVNTPFNSIPLPGSSQSNLSEFFGSGRQSRISLLAEGKLKDAKLTGYYETDFLSAGVTSNNNESNSYTNAATAGVGTSRASWLEFYRRSNVEPGHGNQKRCG